MAPCKQQCNSNACAATRQQSRAPVPNAANAEFGGRAAPCAGATDPDARSAARKSALHVFLLVKRSRDGRHILPAAPPLSSSNTWVVCVLMHTNAAAPRLYTHHTPICFQAVAAIAQCVRQYMVVELRMLAGMTPCQHTGARSVVA